MFGGLFLCLNLFLWCVLCFDQQWILKEKKRDFIKDFKTSGSFNNFNLFTKQELIHLTDYFGIGITTTKQISR